MAISIADIAQRTIVLTSIGLTIYGGVLTAHGIGYRALRTRGYFGGPPEVRFARYSSRSMSTSIDDTNANFGWFGTTWSTNHTVDPMADDYYDGTLWVLPTGGYSEKSTFQQVLYATSGLEEGDHILKVSNENARNTDEYPNYIWLDVDYVAVTGSFRTNAASMASSAIVMTTSTMTTITSSSLIASSSASSISSSIPSSISIPSSSAAPTSAEFSFIAQETPSSSSSPPSSSDFLASMSFSTTMNGEQSLTAQPSPGNTPTSKSYQSIALTQSFDPQSTGTPSTAAIDSQTGSSTVASAESDNDSTTHKTTTVAVSVAVIVIAFIVIIAIAGLWLWRRRRRRAYEEDEDEDERDYLTPAWR
ncbi:hypothetical protein LQV05_006455 [Cryptococcus neoformans]|nr:hypothetical protein LQV05_006455 [Cryptococcus neoformans]